MDPKFIRDISLAYAAVYDQELRQELSEAEFKWDPNKNIIAAKDGKLGIMTKGDSKSWRQPSEQEKGEIPISSTNKFKNSPAGQKFIQQKNAAKLASTASVGSGNGIKPLPNAPKPTSGYGIRQGITAAPAKPGTSTGGFSSGVRPATSTEPTKPAPGSTTSKPITSQPFVSKSQSSAAEIRGMIGRSMERQAAPTPAATPRTDIRNRDVRARGGFDPRFDRRPKSPTTNSPQSTTTTTKPSPSTSTSQAPKPSGLLGTLDKTARDTAGRVGEVIGREKAKSVPGANVPVIGDVIKREGERRGRNQGQQMYDKAKETVGGFLKQDYEYDAFDIILEYLIAEGYADTNKNALVIMANMSEEWKQTILEYGSGGGGAPNVPNAAVKAVEKLGNMFSKPTPSKTTKKQTPPGFNPHQKFN